MNLRRRQFIGWTAIAVAVALAAAWLLQIDYSKKISTNVLDLIPPGESAPELALVRQMASQEEARVMLFALAGGGGDRVPDGAAEFFASALAADPAFDQAQVIGDSSSTETLGRTLLEHRFTLLFPQWLAEMEIRHGSFDGDGFAARAAADAAASLVEFLGEPEAVAFQELLPADPLLLLPNALNQLMRGGSSMQMPEGDNALVWARLAASPLSEEGQEPVFRAIDRAAASLGGKFAGVSVSDTGVNRFAAASRARIQRELATLNAFSFAAVLAVTLLLVRDIHRVLHLLPVMVLAVLGAWTFVTLGFERIHVLVFVVGSLLTGVAIDYGFYLFMQPALAGEDYWAKVRRIAKPMLASCLTAVAGFLLLTFSELPLIRHLGIFIAAGLLCGLVSAVVYFSTVRDPFLEARGLARTGLAAGKWSPWIRRALLILWVASLPGLARIEWRDDIRDLQIPSPSLTAEDARIRSLFGQGSDHTVFLSYGKTADEARESLARLHAWLESEDGGRVRSPGLAAVVPMPKDYSRAMRFLREHAAFPQAMEAALERQGFDAAEFAPFRESYVRAGLEAESKTYERSIDEMEASLAGPMALLMSSGGELSWFATIADKAPAGALPAGIGSITTGQLESLNRVFGTYRQSALRISALGLALVGLGVLLTYGLRDGVRIFAIPLGACLGVFGILGWFGQPLNMFHLIGAFLGVCLTHNLAIFTATSALRHERPPASVRMSALTTAASFGVLAMSGIPVVQALGMTVAIMVVAALLVIEFEHLAELGKNEK